MNHRNYILYKFNIFNFYNETIVRDPHDFFSSGFGSVLQKKKRLGSGSYPGSLNYKISVPVPGSTGF